MSKFIAQVRKAITAGVGAGVAVLGASVLAGRSPGQADYAYAIGAAVLAAGAVFFVPNAPAAKAAFQMPPPPK